MPLWSRIVNAFRGDRLSREIDEELESHIAEAIEQGRDPAEVHKTFGSLLRQREASRDARLLVWLDSLRADAVFGWRCLMKRKVTSAAAILSLGLAIGACTAAFRIIDALLLRPLPVAEPGSLYALTRHGIGPEGKFQAVDEWAYPVFREMRDAVSTQAELIAVGPAERMDLTYGSDQEMEKGHVQCVSGRMFASFGLKPTLGRLTTEADDLKPGGHPYAVLSYDYWSRRFARDPKVIGRALRMGDVLYEVIGVVEPPFTGTETGTMTDIFIPAMMNPWVTRPDATWAKVIARMKPSASVRPVRDQLQAIYVAFERERLTSAAGLPKNFKDNFFNQILTLEPAGAGISGMQKTLRVPLAALGGLLAMVLLIACTNIANLMAAQAAARAREMALRVSIGAGSWRLAQLIIVESALLASLAAAIGGLFAWWSAPLIVSRINPPDNPARLHLPVDWPVMGFALALTLAVTVVLGLAPVRRAFAVKPASALKGGEDPHFRGRLMRCLIAIQVTFCFVVLFLAGLLVTTFDRLTNQPLGFSAERILTLDTVALRPQSPVLWEQVAEHLRTVPGVETVALADWALMNGNSRVNFISINGAPPAAQPAYFRYVAPGWIDAMKIALIDGRDFRTGDTSPGAAIVNQAFARVFFDSQNPVGRRFEREMPSGRMRYQIAGLIRDVRYRSFRESILPVVLIPFHAIDADGQARPVDEATFIVRTTSSNSTALASTLRWEVPRARPEFRVSNIRTQADLNSSHTVRERLLATLAVFFAVTAQLLAGIGLYGVLEYSVLQRRREIGIRMAIGARAADIVLRVTLPIFSMVLVGATAGLALGLGSARYIQTLLYEVKATDSTMLATPSLTILVSALAAAFPAMIRAVRIDPADVLRSE
jgi:predicted permease